MLSGAVSWNVLEEQLANSRTSGDRIRKKIFDFAQEVLQCKKRPSRAQGEEPVSMGNSMWMSSTSERCSSPMQEESSLPDPQREETRDCHRSWLVNTKKARESNPWHWETVSTLQAVLDMSTHLSNYPVPLDTSLSRFVVAKKDLYIPRHSITSVQSAWPGTCMCVCHKVEHPLTSTHHVVFGKNKVG